VTQIGLAQFEDAQGRGTHPPLADEWLARRVCAGWRPQAIVAAADGAISLRTAYRWCKEFTAVEEVRVGAYVATYVVRRTKPPVRVSPWRPA
jgi:hypothetical protein